MWRNYLTVGLRALAKNKTYTFINIFGLTLGFAACLLILLFVRYDLSYDAGFAQCGAHLPGAERAGRDGGAADLHPADLLSGRGGAEARLPRGRGGHRFVPHSAGRPEERPIDLHRHGDGRRELLRRARSAARPRRPADRAQRRGFARPYRERGAQIFRQWRSDGAGADHRPPRRPRRASGHRRASRPARQQPSRSGDGEPDLGHRLRRRARYARALEQHPSLCLRPASARRRSGRAQRPPSGLGRARHSGRHGRRRRDEPRQALGASSRERPRRPSRAVPGKRDDPGQRPDDDHHLRHGRPADPRHRLRQLHQSGDGAGLAAGARSGAAQGARSDAAPAHRPVPRRIDPDGGRRFAARARLRRARPASLFDLPRRRSRPSLSRRGRRASADDRACACGRHRRRPLSRLLPLRLPAFGGAEGEPDEQRAGLDPAALHPRRRPVRGLDRTHHLYGDHLRFRPSMSGPPMPAISAKACWSSRIWAAPRSRPPRRR